MQTLAVDDVLVPLCHCSPAFVVILMLLPARQVTHSGLLTQHTLVHGEIIDLGGGKEMY